MTPDSKPKPKTYLSPPTLTGNEVKYVTEAINSGWIAPLGPFVDRFENDLSQLHHQSHCLATSSGTAALHLALLAVGVKAGDSVLCSDLTFVASANAIVYCGAEPIFIDSEPETWNICPELLKKAIIAEIALGKKPKALLLVHIYGMPGFLDEIFSICQEFEIPIIEDAAEALGSTWNGKALGSLGEMGVLSFNGNKIITTSGGGALLSQSKDKLDYARYLSTQAKDNSVPWFEHAEVGYNYRMSNILAALGCAQLENIQERVAHRRKVFENYVTEFANQKGVTFQKELPQAKSNRWLTVVVLDSQTAGTPQEWAKSYALENIETRPMWKPMHLQRAFSHYRFYSTNTSEFLFENGICLANLI
jgi:dTDP-4-amino-4,6-dideoxygalactose transaminase